MDRGNPLEGERRGGADDHGLGEQLSAVRANGWKPLQAVGNPGSANNHRKCYNFLGGAWLYGER